MTMPARIQKNHKTVVEMRLKKFYSSINQAIVLSEVENGARGEWFDDLGCAELDDDGKPIEGTSEAQKWFNKYLAPYLQIVKQEILSDGRLLVYFPDGSAMQTRLYDSSREWIFYPKNPKKCMEAKPDSFGECSFLFLYYPVKVSHGTGTAGPDFTYHLGKGFEPYKYAWNGTRESLLNGCRTFSNSISKCYCTALIQYDGWKISDDYPYKVSY